METLNKNFKSRIYNSTLPISAWAEDDIPTSKLMLKGVNSLSNSELLSIIIGTGIEGDNSLDIAMRLLGTCDNNLCSLWRMTVKELKEIRGIGEKRALQLYSIFDLARRKSVSEVPIWEKIKSSSDAARLLMGMIGEMAYEEFWILMLNGVNHVVKRERISEGGMSGTVVDPKRVFKVALDNYASGIILGHNHPSGLVNPSENDIKITKNMVQAGKLMNVHVLDHIIVSGSSFYSFADHGEI